MSAPPLRPVADKPAAPGPTPASTTSFEALFYRELQKVTARLHETENLEQLMLEVSADICRLFNAERLTLYAVAEDRQAIVSRVKTGLNTSRDLKLPIGPQSVAGYVAMSLRTVNLADVYDEDERRRLHPELGFLRQVDERSGFHTRQMLVLPISDGKVLHGVLQLMNNRRNEPFAGLEVEGATQLCRTLATAIRQRMQPVDGPVLRPTKYDGLVAEGLITTDELRGAIQRSREQGHSVEQALLADFRILPAQVGASLSKFFGVPYEPFDAGRIRSEALQGPLKRDFVEEQGWLPLEEGLEGLIVMCRDPEAARASRVVPQVFPRQPKIAWRVTTNGEFNQTIDQFYGSEGGSIDELLADLGGPLDDDGGDEGQLESAAADNELVKFVNKVIVDAFHQRASDIHIEPRPGKAKTGIRFRIDGGLIPYIEVPAHFRQAMVTRLKIMCDLDIAERRKPQDGKIRFRKYGPLDIELRVATIPTSGGMEDVVLRLLASGEPIPLDKLGLTTHTRERLEKTVGRPHGLFYVCGPTGSGKTTTLHSILSFLNKPDTKIWTAEDPVEITQKGLRQVQVNKKAGIDFAALMRAFLRADPDIIMVGESRDKETVSMGVEASLTGHLVFSTLHTNSAPESIIRLLDMGMDPFNFADALLGILAQRLARRLCECKQPYEPDEAEISDFIDEYAQDLRATAAWQSEPAQAATALRAQWLAEYGHEGRLRMYRAVGCAKCDNTGYKGRVGLHELLVGEDEVKRLIQARARVADLFTACIAGGMRTLKMDGMEKVLIGTTDLKQVRLVCIK